MLGIEQRGIQPDADAPGHCANATPLFTFANNRGGHDVAGIEFIHEPLALRIDKMSAFGSNTLGDQARR